MLLKKFRSTEAWLVKVAAAAEDLEVFQSTAREAAKNLGPTVLSEAKKYFHKPPPKPKHLSSKYSGLGDWMWTCQTAIFEIWFHLREAAVPALEEIAFGVYDWTQAHATKTLCRLAMDQVSTERTAHQISAALQGWRYEQVMRVHRDVATLATLYPPLQQAYDELIEIYRLEEPADAFRLAAAVADASPDHARSHYGPWLRAQSEGPDPEKQPEPPDARIQACLLLAELFPENHEALHRLRTWSELHPDEQAREELRALLQSLPSK